MHQGHRTGQNPHEQEACTQGFGWGAWVVEDFSKPLLGKNERSPRRPLLNPVEFLCVGRPSVASHQPRLTLAEFLVLEMVLFYLIKSRESVVISDNVLEIVKLN